MWQTRLVAPLASSRLLAVLVFCVALFPRLIGIGQFLTADEKNWVGRSYEFMRALRDVRINDTLQTTHPGISTLVLAGTTMFAGNILSHRPFSAETLHFYTTIAQIPIAITTALLVACFFLVLRKLLPHSEAFLLSLVVALDPFFIGYSKVVHVDALLAGFLGVAVLLFLFALESRREWILVLSAMAAAGALLTKLPALLLLPYVICLLLFYPSVQRASWRFRAHVLAEWFFCIGMLVLLLWPSLLWVPDPIGNVKLVQRDVSTAFLTPHDAEENYTLAPWHYPLTLLNRSTPILLLGILSLILFAIFPSVRRRFGTWYSWRFIGACAFFLLFFTLGMTLGAKKGDRYILPVFPFFDVLGGLGILGGLRLLREHFLFSRKTERLLGALLLCGPLLFFLIRLGPYTIAYYNPLFPPNMSEALGWGEGLDQVAHFLDAQKDDAIVASWYPEELGALTKKPVTHMNAHEQLRVGYVVLYHNMFGRPPSHYANDFIDAYYKKQTPVFTAIVNGLPYAWVYKKPTFTTSLGELTPERSLITTLPRNGESISRIDVLTATFGGKAKTGTFILDIHDGFTGTVLRTAMVPMADVKNNEFTSFRFAPLPPGEGKTYVVVLRTIGTAPGNAPTVRAATKEPGKQYALLTHESLSEVTYTEHLRPGIMGLHVYVLQGTQEILQEEKL